MLSLTRSLATFPSVILSSHSGGLPVEVSLIAQLGVGAGNQIIAGAGARQRHHAAFINELDEPSARIGGIDLDRGDATSLYTFTVGEQGHPFHRHAGHRVFTAISGSAGVRLRFSTASTEQVDADPNQFLHALRHVDIPPDSLFAVRFGGGTWHQFAPLRSRSGHPALFALSCHTNELGGDLPEDLRRLIASNEADIPALTEVLPLALQALLDGVGFDPRRVPTVALSLHAPPASMAARACALTRDFFGRIRGAWGRARVGRGFLSDNGGGRVVTETATSSVGSLLRTQLAGEFDHEDEFRLATQPGELQTTSAARAMSAVLQGFMENRPQGVSRLMSLRNTLVKPLGLRTSPLGCPVSSLLSDRAAQTFAQRFPVLAQASDPDDRRVQVILGADDRHLQFRSCVGVELEDGRAVFTLGTRVRTKNLFGRFYLALIDRVHRTYISPAMLRLAVDHAVRAVAAERAEPPAVAQRGQLA